MTIALIRYIAADALRAERWAPPVFCFIVATAAFNAGGGPAVSCYGFAASVLFAVAVWLTVAVGNSEDPVQTAITVVTVGSALRVRLAKLGTSYLVCLLLAGIALAWPLVGSHAATLAAVVAGGVAQLLSALAGVAFGALLTRPVTNRLGLVVVVGVAACLAELAIPGAPPVRRLLTMFGANDLPGPADVAGPLLLITIETLALSALLIAAAQAIARRRT
jgi:hypothetical protein